MRIGFVGAGRMGRPMLQRLIGAGHTVTAHYLFDEQAPPLIGDGARVSRSLAEVAAGAGAVFVNVLTDAQVRAVCLDDGLLAAMGAGSLLVIHTTSSPVTAELIAAAGAPRGIPVIDAPVSGGPHSIAAGAITLFVGADEATFARARPLLAAYGDPILNVGPTGSGQKVKLLNNAVFSANIGVLATVARLAEGLKLDESVLMSAIRQASGDSRALAGVAARGSVGEFAAGVQQFLGKDVEVVRQILDELGHDLGPLEALYAETAKRSQQS
jgi:3-hydroxyisobutyrate dehydrogenase-like beta-hydroxyacid dehydrogenase